MESNVQRESNTIGIRTFIKRHWKYLILAFLLSVILALVASVDLINTCKYYKGSDELEYRIIKIIWVNVFQWCTYFPAVVFLGKYGIFHNLINQIKTRRPKKVLWSLLRISVAVFGTYEIFLYGHYVAKRLIYEMFEPKAGSYLQLLVAVAFFIILTTDFSRAFSFVPKWNERYPWLLKWVSFLLVGIVGFVNVELLCESKMQTYLDMRFLNIGYWILLMFLLFILIRKIKIAAIITIVVSYVVAFANYLVVMFRGNEILWGDITAAKTAMEVVDNYKFKPDHYFVIVSVITLLSILFLLLLPIMESKTPWNRKRMLTTVLGEAAIIAVLLIGSYNGLLYGYINGNYWDYTLEMANTGYLPYFISNMKCSSKVDLESYSAKDAKTTLESSDTEAKEDDSNTDSPNIIVIMDEAFSDLSVNGELKTNEDYMPYIRSMKKNTIKGNLHLSICGGPTANTEFEFLTRSSLAFLPSGCIPYNQYVKSKIPSLATLLENSKSQYQTMAFHSYSVTGYNRLRAYDCLGFDETLFVEEEDEKNYDLLRGYVTDQSDFEKLESIYEEKKAGNPMFLFNVTMQNHGGYDNGLYTEDKVEVENFKAANQLNTYLTLVKQTDTAVKNLISYFKKEEEPTIIVFFGDHQPKLADEVLEPLMSGSDSKGTSEDGVSAYSNEISRYQVPYFIWANYDIEEQQNLDISANYLASYVLQTAGVDLTAYDEFLLNMRKAYPVVTAREYWDANGARHSWSEQEDTISGLKSYENIQYNLLFDKDNKLTQFFNGN